MKKKITWEQLARYFAGELHGEEYQKMESWIKENSEREEYIKQLYQIWKESEKPPYRLNVNNAWDTLSGNMDKMDRDMEQIRQTATRHRDIKPLHRSAQKGKKYRRYGHGVRRMALAAAIVAIIFTTGIFYYYIHSDFTLGTTADIVNRVFETQDGERATYNLADGTRVILHAGSRLEIPDNYNADNRELFLEGEAYFETVHNPDKPFIVHSQDTYTRVIGTRFLVQSWPDVERKVEVVVSEGRVLFGDQKGVVDGYKNETYITQNQKAVLAGDAAPVLSDITDLAWHIGWTEGRLVFENRPLSEVFQRLERWYDVKIEVADERIGEMKLTAEIDYSLSMNDVMNGVALSLNLDLQRDGRTITFR